jgi:hypothetical protein
MSRTPTPPTPLVARLNRLHADLLDLHKALIEHERTRYEALHRDIASANEFLQLLLGDPFFEWLRALSGLIVQIDEYVSARQPVAEEAGQDLLRAARTLLTPDAAGGPFQREYARALRESPAAAALHARVPLP